MNTLLLLLLTASPQSPDTSAILRLIGRFAAGHACPIASDMALTAAHVVDVRPFDRDIPLLSYRYEGGGGVGVADSVKVQAGADLAIMRPKSLFTRWYPRAAQAPAVGERIWALAYDWRSRKNLFADRVMSGKVTQIVAGHIILDEDMPSGASGSCALNAAGEVVGLVIWSHSTDDGRESVVVVAVFGEWAPDLMANAAVGEFVDEE